MKLFHLFLPFFLCYSCEEVCQKPVQLNATPSYHLIGEIPLPPGFRRITLAEHSFGSWLRKIALKEDNKVYLYDGRLKSNQTVQYAVLDVPVGKKDLQQCADAIMRLRAEYWLSRGLPDSIKFFATNGQLIPYSDWSKGIRYKWKGQNLVAYRAPVTTQQKAQIFQEYLDFIFTYCGTISLHRELRPLKSLNDLQPGDVWIRAGSPGHAMIVVDVAVNNQGQKIFMLAQSYMPAQDIHIVRNPSAEGNDPWYLLNENENLETPEWVFEKGQACTW